MPVGRGDGGSGLFTVRGRRLFALRAAGFEWKEVAEILRTTEGAARTEFSRELKRARERVQAANKLNRGPLFRRPVNR